MGSPRLSRRVAAQRHEHEAGLVRHCDSFCGAARVPTSWPALRAVSVRVSGAHLTGRRSPRSRRDLEALEHPCGPEGVCTADRPISRQAGVRSTRRCSGLFSHMVKARLASTSGDAQSSVSPARHDAEAGRAVEAAHARRERRCRSTTHARRTPCGPCRASGFRRPVERRVDGQRPEPSLCAEDIDLAREPTLERGILARARRRCRSAPAWRPQERRRATNAPSAPARTRRSLLTVSASARSDAHPLERPIRVNRGSVDSARDALRHRFGRPHAVRQARRRDSRPSRPPSWARSPSARRSNAWTSRTARSST